MVKHIESTETDRRCFIIFNHKKDSRKLEILKKLLADAENKLLAAYQENELLNQRIASFEAHDFTEIENLKTQYEQLIDELQQLKKEQTEINRDALFEKDHMLQALKSEFNF